MIPSALGILPVTELKELISTSKRPFRRLSLRKYKYIHYKACHRLPARNEVWGDEEADPGHKDKESSGDVVVADELETPSLHLDPEPTDRIVPDISPGKDVVSRVKRHDPHMLQQHVSPPHVLLQVGQDEADLASTVLVAAKPELTLLQ